MKPHRPHRTQAEPGAGRRGLHAVEQDPSPSSDVSAQSTRAEVPAGGLAEGPPDDPAGDGPTATESGLTAAPSPDSAPLETAGTPPENITPIELLVQLARRGEMDPWDLDLVAVADRYLSVLEQREEMSLPLTGRMLLYACILLHLKAQELSRRYLDALPPVAAQPGEPGYEPLDGGDDGELDGESNPLAVTPGEGLVLLARPRRKRRKVTLDDLLAAIKSFEATVSRVPIEGVLPTALISQAAHVDDVITDIGVVREALSRLGRLSKVSFWDLAPKGMRPASLFVALLHMAAADEIGLAQEKFYGDLTVVRKARAV